MKSFRTAAAVTVTLALAAIFAPRSSAHTWDDRTFITFSTPVELPGIALPAGTYLFETVDIYSNLDLVRVYSADESHLFATIQAMPAYRLQPAPRTVLTFSETPAHNPPALKTWFPRGLYYGHRFIYPDRQVHHRAQLGSR